MHTVFLCFLQLEPKNGKWHTGLRSGGSEGHGGERGQQITDRITLKITIVGEAEVELNLSYRNHDTPELQRPRKKSTNY